MLLVFVFDYTISRCVFFMLSFSLFFLGEGDAMMWPSCSYGPHASFLAFLAVLSLTLAQAAKQENAHIWRVVAYVAIYRHE